MKHKGFTIVELVVVIAVIVILASISIVSYIFVKDDAMDTKIKSAVSTVGDAIALHESSTKSRVYLNGALTSSGTRTGASSATSVDTTLVASKYLKTGYATGLTSKKATASHPVLKAYDCGDDIVVYASLNSPTEEDKTHFASVRTSCGHSNSLVPDGIYSYAKIF